jgi:ectoine hydroxylase-related dioxygenase (phytanoyl-CoA dioxygenase family)
LFVQPPPSVLEHLVAVRLHIDDSSAENGPLRVVPGSHRSGRLPGAEQVALRSGGEVACIAPRGGVVAMKPLLLHASSKSTSSRPRRVLHYLYGPRELPFGLGWCRAV